MRMRCWLAAIPLLSYLLSASAPAPAGTTERVSVSSAGEQGNADSGYTAISADGRFVAFQSVASNLVAGDTNACRDVFVHNRATGATERVSVSSAGEQGNGDSWSPGISADGRFVAFYSYASNLVAGDTNAGTDVFVRDRATGATERVSVSSAGEQGNEGSMYPAISADGRFVAFESYASNLVAGDTNGWRDVFVHDRVTGATERVSVSSAGEQGNGDSWWRVISADGSFVAFYSYASNLVAGDTNGVPDVFVHDRVTGVTERVSVSSAGEQGNWGSINPAISANGRFVAFDSYASNLVAGDTNGDADVFVHDRATGATERVSVSSAGEQGNGESQYPAISADGRFVAFDSYASNLVAGDTNGDADVFVHDRATGATERVSVSSAGEQGNGGSWWPVISAEGRFVAFGSVASNLVAEDTNGVADVFVRDREGFSDVPFSNWAFSQISACVDAGVVTGYPDGTYQPSQPVTRDQMAVYVARALVIPSGDAAIPDPVPPPTFSDVSSTHWAYKQIEYAVSRNVVQGYDPTHYVPDAVVDRGQMAVFVARSQGWVNLGDDMTTAPQVFPDVPAGFWAGTAVKACVDNAVVQGYLDGLYHPSDPVTRDQMAVYVARAFELPM